METDEWQPSDEESLADLSQRLSQEKGERKRARNFHDKEKEKLLTEMENCISSLKGALHQGLTNQMKNDMWEDIAVKISGLGFAQRTAKDVKKKWSDWSSSVRKKWDNIKREVRQTGGGKSTTDPLSPMEEKVLELMPRVTKDGIKKGRKSSSLGRSQSNAATNEVVMPPKRPTTSIPSTSRRTLSSAASMSIASTSLQSSMGPRIQQISRAATHNRAVPVIVEADGEIIAEINVQEYAEGIDQDVGELAMSPGLSQITPLNNSVEENQSAILEMIRQEARPQTDQRKRQAVANNKQVVPAKIRQVVPAVDTAPVPARAPRTQQQPIPNRQVPGPQLETMNVPAAARRTQDHPMIIRQVPEPEVETVHIPDAPRVRQRLSAYAKRQHDMVSETKDMKDILKDILTEFRRLNDILESNLEAV